MHGNHSMNAISNANENPKTTILVIAAHSTINKSMCIKSTTSRNMLRQFAKPVHKQNSNPILSQPSVCVCV